MVAQPAGDREQGTGVAVPVRAGDWIQTYTGRQYWPFDPRPDEVDIIDVAHALSLLCRFTGHVRQFYSVAQHSVIVSRLVPREHARWALLHDAAEAYTNDISAPVKRDPTMGAFRRLDFLNTSAVAKRFKLEVGRFPYPLPFEVRQADEVALATECRDLLGKPPAPWGLKAQPDPRQTIDPLPWHKAEQLFIQRFRDLFDDGGVDREDPPLSGAGAPNRFAVVGRSRGLASFYPGPERPLVGVQ